MGDSVLTHHLFLTQTLYHFILSSGLAFRARRLDAQPSVLLFVRDFDGAGEFLRAVQDWAESPFDTVVDLGDYDRGTTRRSRRRSSAQLAERVVRGVRQYRPASVSVFNDRHEFAQVALETAALEFPQAARIYVEDGTAAYSNKLFKPRNLLQRLERRWRYGAHWTDLRILGTHPKVQRRILNYPAHARAELKALGGVEPYPLPDLHDSGLEGLARRVATQRGLDPDMLAGADVFMAISYSNVLRRLPDYPDKVRRMLGQLQASGIRVAYKYHPRETEADFVGARQAFPGGEIPRGLPMEFVSLLAGHRPKVLLADFSTSLLLASKLNASVHAAALVPAGLDDLGLSALYASAGIPVLTDADAVVAYRRSLD